MDGTFLHHPYAGAVSSSMSGSFFTNLRLLQIRPQYKKTLYNAIIQLIFYSILRLLLLLEGDLEPLIPRYRSKAYELSKLSFLNNPRSVLTSLSTLQFGGTFPNHFLKSLLPPLASISRRRHSGHISDALHSLLQKSESSFRYPLPTSLLLERPDFSTREECDVARSLRLSLSEVHNSSL